MFARRILTGAAIPLFWTIFGAILGPVLEPTVTGANKEARRIFVCDAESKLYEGRRVRLAALRTQDPAKRNWLHKTANGIFNSGIQCDPGNPLLRIYRSQALCFRGWDDVYDPVQGLARIRSAYVNNTNIPVDYLMDEAFCPRTAQRPPKS